MTNGQNDKPVQPKWIQELMQDLQNFSNQKQMPKKRKRLRKRSEIENSEFENNAKKRVRLTKRVVAVPPTIEQQLINKLTDRQKQFLNEWHWTVLMRKIEQHYKHLYVESLLYVCSEECDNFHPMCASNLAVCYESREKNLPQDWKRVAELMNMALQNCLHNCDVGLNIGLTKNDKNQHKVTANEFLMVASTWLRLLLDYTWACEIERKDEMIVTKKLCDTLLDKVDRQYWLAEDDSYLDLLFARYHEFIGENAMALVLYTRLNVVQPENGFVLARLCALNFLAGWNFDKEHRGALKKALTWLDSDKVGAYDSEMPALMRCAALQQATQLVGNYFVIPTKRVIESGDKNKNILLRSKKIGNVFATMFCDRIRSYHNSVYWIKHVELLREVKANLEAGKLTRSEAKLLRLCIVCICLHCIMNDQMTNNATDAFFEIDENNIDTYDAELAWRYLDDVEFQKMLSFAHQVFQKYKDDLIAANNLTYKLFYIYFRADGTKIVANQRRIGKKELLELKQTVILK